MKSLTRALGILAVASVSLLQAGSGYSQQQNNTPIAYTGYVMDGACAALGSHTQMMSKEGIKTTKDCVLECVKDGSKFVLYIPSTSTAYNLDDQEKPQEYAAEKVTVIGSFDGPTKTIHIQSIMAAP
jgi:hypothetical protein